MKSSLIIFLMIFFALGQSVAQDAFFYESKQISGFINPALTGLNGSLTFSTVGKEQFTSAIDGFISGGVSVEQSWSCAGIDAGIYHIFDKEGDGLFKTNHSAISVVYTVPFEVKNTFHNVRIGTKFQHTYKDIDWKALTFSDQVDAKYNLTDAFGIPNQTSFIPPDWDHISRFTMGLGLIHKVNVGFLYKWSLTWGAAAENYTNIFESIGYDSILRLENDKDRIVDKWSLYFAPEFPLTKSYKDYFGLRPSLLILEESSLTNVQFGFDINYRRAFGLGAYLSTGHLKNFNRDTKSLILNTYVRVFSSQISQLNIGFQYIHNVGGLSEVFGQAIQVSVSYSLRREGCSSVAKSTSDCPPVSRRNKSLYENIWFSAPGKKR